MRRLRRVEKADVEPILDYVRGIEDRLQHAQHELILIKRRVWWLFSLIENQPNSSPIKAASSSAPKGSHEQR